MKLALPGTARVGAVLLAIATLAVGLLIGYTLAVRSAPAPREPALLWDDYILAVAALYQRDGDLAAAKERLARLSTDDPGASVAAFAAIYVPDGRYGETQTAALRDLAVALTGRALPPHTSGVKQAPAAEPGPSDLFAGLVRNQGFWALVAALSIGVVGTTVVRYRRPAAPPAAVPAVPRALAAPRPAAREAAIRPRRAEKRAIERPTSAPVPKAEPHTIRITQSFAYDGEDQPLEEMAPVTDPLTGRMIAGCGLTNGPRAGGENGGYVGFLVWLHEMGSREMPQTLGLIADGAGGACKAAIAEWADYARLDEVVAVKLGVARTFETRHLRAAVCVTDLAQARPGRVKHKVFRRLEVRLDVEFKADSRPAAAGGT